MDSKKYIIMLLSVILIFAVSCSENEDVDNTVSDALSQSVASHDNVISSALNSSEILPGSQTTSSVTAQGSTSPPNDDMSSQTLNSEPDALETVSVTVPEGYTFMQIANLLEQKGVCSAKDFYDAAQSYKVKSFTIPESSNRVFKLEGYLYPDTYEFYKQDKPTNVIIKMLNNYAAKSGMPSDDTLILASIIEREVRSQSHMAMVSSVFHNRLDAGMILQSDATREYINDYVTGNSLLSDTSKYAELYNTYKCSGLPAGPICNPSKRAIDAAKNPASSDYYYFFFGNDNDNHYSKTLEEHNAQMEKYGVQFGN